MCSIRSGMSKVYVKGKQYFFRFLCRYKSRRCTAILWNFISKFFWCFVFGLSLGNAHEVVSEMVRSEIVNLLISKSNSEKFQIFSVVYLTLLGGSVALFGRVRSPSLLRLILCYWPVDVLLSFVSVFFGLAFGFNYVTQALSFWVIFVAFLLSCWWALPLALWMSSPGRMTANECAAEIMAAISAVLFPVIAISHYYPH